MGKTMFVSSHILSEIEEVCTHIGIIEAGQLVAMGTMEEVRQLIQSHRVIMVALTGQVDEARAWLAAQEGVMGVEPLKGNGRGDLEIAFAGDEQALAQLLKGMVQAGLPVVGFHEEEGDLEDVFMRLTKGIVS